MRKDIKRKLNSARVRLALNKLIDILRCVLFCAGIIVLMGIAVKKLLAVQLLTFHLTLGLSAICGVVSLVWWFVKMPTKQKTSLLIDEKLKLKERMSCLMVFDSSEDLFAQAACWEATETVKQVNLQKHFPISLSKNWFYSLGTWLTVALLIALVPQYDLLGYIKKQQEQVKQAREIVAAKKTVELTTSSVKLAVKQLGDKDLESELELLSAM